MGKDYWNRKSIYSIRKFTVGTCSVLIGTCSILFGANLASASTVSADETPVAVATEKVEKETPKEEAVDSKASEQPVTTETVNSEAVETNHEVEKKVEAPTTETTPEKKETSDVEKQAPAVTQDQSAQTEKPELKPATNDEVKQLIEDRKVEFNQNWHFKLNANAKDAVKPDADVSSWKKLDLPHDWSIYNDFDHDSPAQNEGGQLNGGDAWYRKTFKLDEEDLNKNVRITFDGVYMDSQVYVNGQLVGHYPNGYNQFSYDITDYLHKDGRENVVAVHAINKQPSSRWYS